MKLRPLEVLLLFCFIVEYSEGDTEDSLYLNARKYVCSCFCLLRKHTVNEINLAQTTGSVSFGLASIPLPLVRSNNIKTWLNLYGLNQLAVGKTSKKIKINEFVTGIISKSPPIVPLAERERALNYVTEGDYFRLKERYEAFKAPSDIEEIEKYRDYYGIPSGKHFSSRKKLYTISDNQKYSSVLDKKVAWSEKCFKTCKEVANQAPEKLYFQSHLEFSLIKHSNDLYDEGSWISSEPIHVAGIEGDYYSTKHNIPKDKKWKKWETLFHDKYRDLFHYLRHPEKMDSDLCPALQTKFDGKHLSTITWSELKEEYKILRDPIELNVPKEQKTVLLSYNTENDNNDIVDIDMELDPFIPQRHVIPVKIKETNWIDLSPKKSVHQKLHAESINVFDWPNNNVRISTKRISLQYRLTAQIDKSRENTFKIVSLFEGNPSISRPGFCEFLGVYIDKKESEQLFSKLRWLILHQWGFHIIKLYNKNGLRIGQSNQKSKISSSSRNYIEEKPDKEDFYGLLANGDERLSSFQSFLETKNTFYSSNKINKHSHHTVEPLDTQIRHIKIQYIGEIFSAHWQYVADSRIYPDNKLTLIVKPVLVEIERADGIILKSALDCESSPIFFSQNKIQLKPPASLNVS